MVTYTNRMVDMSEELREMVFGQRLRADAASKATQVLEASDRLLRTNPQATLEEVAEAAGVSRTTVYRRFPTRQDLSVALSRWAVGRITEALEQAEIGVAPAYVALYQAARNVIGVKVSLEYARGLALPDDGVVHRYRDRMREMADQLLTQCRDEGVIRDDVDLGWARSMFYALVHEAVLRAPALGTPLDAPASTTTLNASTDYDATHEHLTRLVVDSLLGGLGTRPAPRHGHSSGPGPS